MYIRIRISNCNFIYEMVLLNPMLENQKIENKMKHMKVHIWCSPIQRSIKKRDEMFTYGAVLVAARTLRCREAGRRRSIELGEEVMKEHQNVDTLYTKSLMVFLEANDVQIFSLNNKMNLFSLFKCHLTYRLTKFVNQYFGILSWIYLTEALLSRLSHMTNRSNLIISG